MTNSTFKKIYLTLNCKVIQNSHKLHIIKIIRKVLHMSEPVRRRGGITFVQLTTLPAKTPKHRTQEHHKRRVLSEL